MAQTIKLKRSSVAGNVPTAEQLALGEVAINTFDGKVYIKKDNGTASVVEVGAGASGATSLLDLTDVSGDGTNGQLLSTDGNGTFSFVSVGSGGGVAYTRQVYSATNNQTIFAATYDPGFVDVYLNGVKLLLSLDYTATNGTSITLAEGSAGGDVLEIISYGGVVLEQVQSLQYTKYRYVATASQTLFSGGDSNGDTLSYVDNLDVYLNGTLLDPSQYNATSGSTLILAQGASAGDILQIHTFGSDGVDSLTVNGDFTLGTTQVTASGVELNLLDSLSRGSIIYGNSSSETSALSAGTEDQILKSDGTDIYWGDPTSTRFQEKTANATLEAGDKIIVDTSTSSLTMTLPTSPVLGDEIAIIDGWNNAGTNNIIVATNGEKIDGTAGDMNIDVNGAAFNIVYYNASRGWIFTER